MRELLARIFLPFTHQTTPLTSTSLPHHLPTTPSALWRRRRRTAPSVSFGQARALGHDSVGVTRLEEGTVLCPWWPVRHLHTGGAVIWLLGAGLISVAIDSTRTPPECGVYSDCYLHAPARRLQSSTRRGRGGKCRCEWASTRYVARHHSPSAAHGTCNSSMFFPMARGLFTYGTRLRH